MAADILYTVAEIAKLWRCSRQHIYNEIARGRLVATQAAGGGRAKTRVAESALADYVRQNSRRAGTRTRAAKTSVRVA